MILLISFFCALAFSTWVAPTTYAGSVFLFLLSWIASAYVVWIIREMFTEIKGFNDSLK